MNTDKATFPLLPSKSTLARMSNFPSTVYNLEESSTLYKFIDAIVGDPGIGALKKELLISRMNQRLDTTFFSDLDRVFGNLGRITRLASESYTINPSIDLLTTEEWDEIRVKDSWYRARIKDFFAALALGGSPAGLKRMVRAAIGVDAEIYELWKFQDYFSEIYGIDDIETLTNLVRNPSFEYGTTDWSILTGGTGASLATATSPAGSVETGTKSLFFTTGTTVTNPVIQMINIPATPLKQYTFSFYYYAPTIDVLTTANLIVINKNAADGTISTLTSTNQTLVATTRTRLSYTFTTPALTDHVTIQIRLNGSVTTPTKTFYVDSAQLSAGAIQTYFDGDTSGYRWTGVAGESASVKASPIDALSRLKVPSRNEIVIYPHKETLTVVEKEMIREMVTRLAPVDSVITIKNTGYAVNVPIAHTFATADSTYFQIDQYVTGLNIQGLTEDEEPNASYRWLQNGVEALAPNPAFLESQEYSQYYLYTTNDKSSIDSVQYFKETMAGAVSSEADYKIIEKSVSSWSQWTFFDKVDSPDNYPGGKNGRNPRETPAVTKSGAPYIFAYASQQTYVDQMKVVLNSIGGQTRTFKEIDELMPGSNQNVNKGFSLTLLTEKGEYTETMYRIPISATESVINSWKAEQAIADTAPVRASTITSGWYNRPFNVTPAFSI